MNVKEEDIVYEAPGGAAWVWRDKKGKEQAEILKALMGNPLDRPMTGFK
jgi:hypothetical protein